MFLFANSIISSIERVVAISTSSTATAFFTPINASLTTPPTKYIQQYRVDKSKELLVNTELSIDEVAVAVGFANASYFCKVFKSEKGVSPTEYKRRKRAQTDRV